MNRRGRSVSKTRRRGPAVEVSPWWAEEARGRCQAKYGAQNNLAKAIGFSASRVSDLLNKRTSGRLLALAVADALNMPHPIPAGDEAEWFALGQELRFLDQDTFKGELSRLRFFVKALRRLNAAAET